MLNKAIVNLSRHVAFIGISMLIFGVCAYFVMQAYFGFGHSWVVPLTISASDDQALELNMKVLTTETQISQYVVDRGKQQISVTEMEKHRASLSILESVLQTSVAREAKQSANEVADLRTLDSTKKADIDNTRVVVANTAVITNQLQSELAAGLITKTDYAGTWATINGIRTNATDEKIEEVAVRGQIRQLVANSTALLDIANKQIELRSEIAQLDNAIVVAKQTINAENTAIADFKAGLSRIKGNPYNAVADGGRTDILFVPYGTKLKSGDPVYNCAIGIMVCWKVGKVLAVFTPEQLGQNPAPLFFKTPVRGYTVQVQFDRRKDAESKILFASKPVGF